MIVGALSVAVAGPAAAGNRTASITFSGDVSATDNVFAATADRNEGDLALTLRPGLLLGYEAPRMSHELAVESEVIEFVSHSDAPSLSLRVGASSNYVTSKYTNLTTQFDASNGVITALSSRLTPDQTGPQLIPVGRVDVMQGSATEGLSWSSGRDYTLSQSLFARASRTDDNADDVNMATAATIVTSVEAGMSLGVDRQFRRGDALSLSAGASVLRLERDAPPDAMLGPRLDRQLNPRARLAWRHDFNRIWSAELDVGGVYVHPYAEDPNNPDVEQGDGLFPILGAGLAYTEVWGRATLQARRDVSPNLFVAQNTLNDAATLALAMPLPLLDDSQMRRPRLVALGSLGVSRTQLIDASTSDLASSFYIGRADVGIGYSPRPGFTYGVRYEFIYQTGDSAAVAEIPGFYRNTISFTFQIRYPDRVAGGETAKKRQDSVRADGSDLVPIGVDPVSTEIVDDQGGGER